MKKIFKLIGAGAIGAIKGAIKPTPLSGIITGASEAVKAVKDPEKSSTEAITKLIFYVASGACMLYALTKGILTFDQVKELVKLIN